jgi:hypothetical protein
LQQLLHQHPNNSLFHGYFIFTDQSMLARKLSYGFVEVCHENRHACLRQPGIHGFLIQRKKSPGRAAMITHMFSAQTVVASSTIPNSWNSIGPL